LRYVWRTGTVVTASCDEEVFTNLDCGIDKCQTGVMSTCFWPTDAIFLSSLRGDVVIIAEATSDRTLIHRVTMT